jgi:hypothetical protein
MSEVEETLEDGGLVLGLARQEVLQPVLVKTTSKRCDNLGIDKVTCICLGDLLSADNPVLRRHHWLIRCHLSPRIPCIPEVFHLAIKESAVRLHTTGGVLHVVHWKICRDVSLTVAETSTSIRTIIFQTFMLQLLSTTTSGYVAQAIRWAAEEALSRLISVNSRYIRHTTEGSRNETPIQQAIDFVTWTPSHSLA